MGHANPSAGAAFVQDVETILKEMAALFGPTPYANVELMRPETPPVPSDQDLDTDDGLVGEDAYWWQIWAFDVRGILGTNVLDGAVDALEETLAASARFQSVVGAANETEAKRRISQYYFPFVRGLVADPATDTFNRRNHGLQDGDLVRPRSVRDDLPASLAAATDYFVVGRTAHTLQLSTTSGGAAVDLSDAGESDDPGDLALVLPRSRACVFWDADGSFSKTSTSGWRFDGPVKVLFEILA